MAALLATLLFSAGCVSDPPVPPADDSDAGTDAAPDPCADPDGDDDGFSSLDCGGEDCSDADPSSYPGAADDVGDLVDQSCDGVDGLDGDGDGFSSTDSGGDDCDDGHAEIYPGADKMEGEDWILQVVDDGDTGINPAIFVDAEGITHIAYTSIDGEVFYVNDEVGTWSQPESLFDATWGQNVSIEVFERTVFVVFNAGNDSLVLATKDLDAGGWATETVVSGESGFWPSMRIGADGTVHLAWQDLGPAEEIALQYANDSSGDWSIETVEALPLYGLSTAMALDAAGAPHVAYRACMVPGDCIRSAPNQMRYAVRDAGAWTIENVTGADHYLLYGDLELDSDENAHVAFMDDYEQDLVYATNATGEWVEEVLDSPGDTGWSADIELDSTGHVLVAFGDYGRGALALVTNVTGDWLRTDVEVRGRGGWDLALALDARDSPRLAYFQGDDFVLGYATTDGLDENCDGVDW